MRVVVNNVCRCKPEIVTDLNGDAVTTLVSGDWTKKARGKP